MGVSTSTIERRLWLAEHLAPADAEILKKMGKQQPSRSELMGLARLNSDRQEKVASLLASGAIKLAGEYREQSEPEVSDADAKATVCHSPICKI